MSGNTDERLIQLEMTVAHQDATIQELSDMVHRQWAAIDALKRQIERLDATKKDDDPEDEGDRRPPHY